MPLKIIETKNLLEHMNLDNRGEERYKELNTYFRIKIDQLLRQDEQLKEQLEQSSKLQINDIVTQMNEADQERWTEFLKLDKLKLEVDMWNHLHGIGTPFQPGLGFNSPEDTTW